MKLFQRRYTQNQMSLRIIIIAGLYAIVVMIIIQRLYQVQIVQKKDYSINQEEKVVHSRKFEGTRGNIYDRYGNILARNILEYQLTLEDPNTSANNSETQRNLNSVAYQIIKILDKNGDRLELSLPIGLDGDGNYIFLWKDRQLARFKADIYGYAKIDQMKEEEKNATAEEVIHYLCSEKKFKLINDDGTVNNKETDHGISLPTKLSEQEILQIIALRYTLFINHNSEYNQTTIAKNLSQNSVAEFMEKRAELSGTRIKTSSRRVYEDGLYFSDLIGYTGLASEEELKLLQKASEDYDTNTIIGKTGIEQYMEESLHGRAGIEQSVSDSAGKALEVDKEHSTMPEAGNDIYLTIDKELQIATYKILEQKLAGILLSNIIPQMEFDATKVSDASQIRIPIGDVYVALIKNNIIDIDQMSRDNASADEKDTWRLFLAKKRELIALLKKELLSEVPVAQDKLVTEQSEYIDFIINSFAINDLQIVQYSNINTEDTVYKNWKEQKISAREFLTYAIMQKNWIDISKISKHSTYMDTEECYQAIIESIFTGLEENKEFTKLVFREMIINQELSATRLCLLLYRQNVLPTSDEDYSALVEGTLSPYNFMLKKIKKLEITPAQLALDPCSGSAVIIDPNNGKVLACVSYPGYDNNRLADHMEEAYYNKLSMDLTAPFYNKATQQLTAPGSTFKVVTAAAALTEGAINSGTSFYCDGVFKKVEPNIHCWHKQGHGALTVTGGIQNSCNVFFNEAAYQLGSIQSGIYSESTALSKLQRYAEMFGLGEKSGIEIAEAQPHITDQYAIPSSIGQGTHHYSTVQLARYAGILATGGSCYSLTLLDHITDSRQKLIKNYQAVKSSEVSLTNETWDDLHRGMKLVVENNKYFKELTVSAAGKTGTAQEIKTRPSHGLFIGYAPYEAPKIAVAIRIAYGYTSGNAVGIANDVFNYYFNLKDNEDIITGLASEPADNSHTD